VSTARVGRYLNSYRDARTPSIPTSTTDKFCLPEGLEVKRLFLSGARRRSISHACCPLYGILPASLSLLALKPKSKAGIPGWYRPRPSTKSFREMSLYFMLLYTGYHSDLAIDDCNIYRDAVYVGTVPACSRVGPRQ